MPLQRALTLALRKSIAELQKTLQPLFLDNPVAGVVRLGQKNDRFEDSVAKLRLLWISVYRLTTYPAAIRTQKIWQCIRVRQIWLNSSRLTCTMPAVYEVLKLKWYCYGLFFRSTSDNNSIRK